MKPAQLYNRLFIGDVPTDNGNAATTFLIQLAGSGKFPLQFGHSKPGATDEEDHTLLLAPETFEAKFHTIVPSPVRTSLTIIVEFFGEVPPSIKRGTYTLAFEGGTLCSELPDEMFEDGNVDESYLREWRKSA